MPRAFTEEEKEKIRDSLIEQGRNIFGQYGLKKTTVEDIVRATGIAKGSFYNFYSSKEELLFDIHEKLEEETHEYIRSLMNKYSDVPRKFFHEVFKLIESYFEDELVVRLLSNPEEYQQYFRSFSPEKLARHLNGDNRFAEEILGFFQKKKVLKNIKAETLAGVIKALFMMNVHKKEIGEKQFSQVISFIWESVLDKLFPIEGD